MYWITGILGLVLIAAPYGLGYSTSSAALWSALVLGAIVALASGYKAVTRDTATWEYWAVGIAGLVTVLAPFVLGFGAQTTALLASVILGAFAAVLSATQLSSERPIERPEAARPRGGEPHPM